MMRRPTTWLSMLALFALVAMGACEQCERQVPEPEVPTEESAEAEHPAPVRQAYFS